MQPSFEERKSNYIYVIYKQTVIYSGNLIRQLRLYVIRKNRVRTERGIYETGRRKNDAISREKCLLIFNALTEQPMNRCRRKVVLVTDICHWPICVPHLHTLQRKEDIQFQDENMISTMASAFCPLLQVFNRNREKEMQILIQPWRKGRKEHRKDVLSA